MFSGSENPLVHLLWIKILQIWFFYEFAVWIDISLRELGSAAFQKTA